MRLAELIAFFDYARDRGIISPNAIHNWLGAIGAISHCLEDEERTVEFLQGHLDIIRERLVNTRRDIRPQTIESYLQRADTAIGNFLAWKKDPTAWENELASRPRKDRKKKKSAARALIAERDERGGKKSVPATPPHGEKSHRNTVQVPTEDGDVIRLEFPETYGMRDVMKVVWALAVHAHDFDPEAVLKNFGKPPGRDDKKQWLSAAGSH